MPAVVNILKSIIKNAQKGEMPLWHGTGVSPNELMQGAKAAEPRFSSEFFHSGTGGMMQGPGLYATEIVPVAKKYGDMTGEIKSTFRGGVGFDELLAKEGIENKAAFNDAISSFSMIHPHYSEIHKDQQAFTHEKGKVLRELTDRAKMYDTWVRVGEGSETEASLARDYEKVANLIKGITFDDFKLDANRYLYRVAFPKERYLDWYEKDPGSVDVVRAFNKVMGDQEVPLKEVDMSGNRFFNDATLTAKQEYFRRNKHTSINPVDEKKFHINALLQAFEKAGFAGTKYRGDRQSGNYYNYVLQKPERARILDAFKFGLGGVSLTPFLSQPKTQSRKNN